jgi:hypothetical protein
MSAHDGTPLGKTGDRYTPVPKEMEPEQPQAAIWEGEPIPPAKTPQGPGSEGTPTHRKRRGLGQQIVLALSEGAAAARGHP